MNILITSGGRRSYLVDYFRKALGKDGHVLVSNNSSISTAYWAADAHFLLPQAFEEDYIPKLLALCKAEKVDALLTLFDVEIAILAKHRAAFEAIGVTLLVSPEECVAICNDKWKTYKFLRENGFDTIPSFLTVEEALLAVQEGRIHFPLIVKPRFGMGSLAIYTAENEEELRLLYKKSKRAIEKSFLHYESQAFPEYSVLIQACIQGQEYGLDIVNNLQGNYLNTIVKKKLAMRSGETDLAITEENPRLIALGQRISEHMGHYGNLDCDVFVQDDKLYVLEMNARFGGGYPFSHIAGADVPKALVYCLRGEPVPMDLVQAKPGVLAQKSIGIIEIPQP